VIHVPPRSDEVDVKRLESIRRLLKLEYANYKDVQVQKIAAAGMKDSIPRITQMYIG
jgi:hypothetical protein